MAKLQAGITREDAFALLQEHNKEAFHIEHGETLEGTMRYFAREFDPENEEFWRCVGMLHDLDFEEFPEEHCVKELQWLNDMDFNPAMTRAIVAHGWGLTGAPFEPESQMEKLLFASDELTGLIGAAALMRPSKSCSDMELKSLKKKYKDKKFAAGCSREVIQQGADMLGWELDELLQKTLDAMKSLEA